MFTETPRPKKLLNIDSNAKTVKGQKKGFMTAILYLAPGDLSGFQVCPKASAGCLAACLNTAGRAGIVKTGETTNPIQRARIAKTKWFFEDRAGFMLKLLKEIELFVNKAERKGLTPCVRLNGTSDIPWERIALFAGAETLLELFPDVQFYDYTKRANRKNLPRNYHLTFSLAEDNDADALQALQNGINVAAVFRPHLPRNLSFINDGVLYAYPVVDGDETDLRFLDPAGVVVGLKAKGKARKDTSGFVRDAY